METLLCEVCEKVEYYCTDKGENGEIVLVCKDCKDARLTERNAWREFEGDFEGEDSIAMADVKVLETDSDYITQMADRFGVGGSRG